MIRPDEVHPTHDMADEGILVSDPVCQKCRTSAVDVGHDLLKQPCDAAEAAPSFDPLWDERARGPRMSNVKGKTIYKYQMPVQEEFIMRLPLGAVIIRMADQGGMLWLWAIVDTEQPLVERKFHAFKTGAAIPEHLCLIYRGFVAIYIQQELGLYIFEDVGK